MERKFRMYCVDVDKDGSEFKVILELNDRIIEKEVVYSFDDVLGISYEFFKKNCEKYNFDGRRDSFDIDINYKY